MSLPTSQQRALSQIEKTLADDHPGLGALFATFTRLAGQEAMPVTERVTASPGGCRGPAVAVAAADVADSSGSRRAGPGGGGVVHAQPDAAQPADLHRHGRLRRRAHAGTPDREPGRLRDPERAEQDKPGQAGTTRTRCHARGVASRRGSYTSRPGPRLVACRKALLCSGWTWAPVNAAATSSSHCAGSSTCCTRRGATALGDLAARQPRIIVDLAGLSSSMPAASQRWRRPQARPPPGGPAASRSAAAVRRILTIIWEADGFAIHASVAEAAASAGTAPAAIARLDLPSPLH